MVYPLSPQGWSTTFQSSTAMAWDEPIRQCITVSCENAVVRRIGALLTKTQQPCTSMVTQLRLVPSQMLVAMCQWSLYESISSVQCLFHPN